MSEPATPSLEDIVIAVYAAIDDALSSAGIKATNGKLLKRPGPAPQVDDREILCLALIEEMLGFQSDNSFHLWLGRNPTMCALFPRRLARQNFADRRVLLTGLLETLCKALCLMVEGPPPFSLSTATPWKSAARFEPRRRSAWGDLPAQAAAMP